MRSHLLKEAFLSRWKFASPIFERGELKNIYNDLEELLAAVTAEAKHNGGVEATISILEKMGEHAMAEQVKALKVGG